MARIKLSHAWRRWRSFATDRRLEVPRGVDALTGHREPFLASGTTCIHSLAAVLSCIDDVTSKRATVHDAHREKLEQSSHEGFSSSA